MGISNSDYFSLNRLKELFIMIFQLRKMIELKELRAIISLFSCNYDLLKVILFS